MGYFSVEDLLKSCLKDGVNRLIKITNRYNTKVFWEASINDKIPEVLLLQEVYYYDYYFDKVVIQINKEEI